MDSKELARDLKTYGVTGAGGAGFPTYGKIDNRAKTIILNCAECEPLLKVHRQLLQKYAYEIMSTLKTMANAMGANEIIIAVKEAYTNTIESVKANLDSFMEITLKLLPEVYPMGDEVILIYETLGKKVPPGSIPIEIGVAVFNVETVLNIYNGLEKGEPVTSKYLTVAGEVSKPSTFKVPIGMKVEEVVQLAGGPVIKSPVYFMGGPMTGSIVNSFDTVTKTTNAILVLPKDHGVIQKFNSNTSLDLKRAMSVCCQCEMCTELCPRYLLGNPITPHLFMRAATSGTTQDLEPFLQTMFCCSCGVCELYACPQGLSPRKLITEYKAGLRKKGIQIPKGIPSKDNHSLRDYRKVPMERLTARLGLKEYDVEANLVDNTIIPEIVKISLSQHIGAKAVSVVNVHDMVVKGQEIGASDGDKLSLPVHASITGEVIEVTENFIKIRTTSTGKTTLYR